MNQKVHYQRLIDAMGTTVKETKWKSITASYHLTCATSTFPKGMYLIQILAGEQLLSKKIILQ